MNESRHMLNLWQAWPIEGPWHLTPLLPGHRLSDRNDLVIATNAAYALAWLDQALAMLADLPLPEGSQFPGLFGQLAHCHPRVPDPLAAVEHLPIDRDHARQIRH